MNRAIVVVALLALVLVVSGGCAASRAHSDCAGCAQMESTGTGWCDSCGMGMANGQETTCKGCYAAMTGGPACPAHRP